MLTRDAYGGGRVGRRREVILRVLARGRAPPPGPATAARGRRACVRGCGFYALCLERYMYALTTKYLSAAAKTATYELPEANVTVRESSVLGSVSQSREIHTLTL